MDEAYCTNGELRNSNKFYSETLKETDNMGDVGVDGEQC
jgi:hypothetical protein